MANVTLHELYSRDNACAVLAGSATFGASSAIASSSLPAGVSIAKSATGVFDVSLTDQWSELLHVAVKLVQATPADLVAAVVSFNVTTATAASRKIVFQTWDISGAAAADPTSGDKVTILLILRNSNTARKGV